MHPIRSGIVRNLIDFAPLLVLVTVLVFANLGDS